MRMWTWIELVLLLVFGFGRLSAYGAELSKPNFSIGYEADYHEPSSLEHNVSVERLLGSSGLSLGLTAVGAQNPRSWRGVQLADPFLELSIKPSKIAPRLRAWGDLRAFFPASTKSQKKAMLFGIRGAQLLSYSLGQHWKIGNKTVLKWTCYGDLSGMSSKKASALADLTSYVRPLIAYEALPELDFVLRYEMNFIHRQDNGLMNFDNDGFSLQPGVSWDIRPDLNLYPFLVIKTAGPKASTDPIYVAAELTWDAI